MTKNTIKQFICLVFLPAIVILSGEKAFTQDTFSIVAIDSATGQVGSAGASCVGSSTTYPHGAAILSDVIPGVGVIHTQASWSPVNQQNAHNWMMMGLPPQQIIDSLVAHDAGNNPAIRQYGIADYNGGHPRAASFTGVGCQNYKNDTNHIYYSIQGNILMGQMILDSMQSRFLNTTGTLADRLMAALQGAKVVGADTRCAPKNASSQSSFLRVANMTNRPDSLYCDLWMAYPTNYSGQYPVDPIDSLQTLYNIWKTTTPVAEHKNFSLQEILVINGEAMCITFDFSRCRDYLYSQLEIYDILGCKLKSVTVNSRLQKIDLSKVMKHGILVYRVLAKDRSILGCGKFFL